MVEEIVGAIILLVGVVLGFTMGRIKNEEGGD